MAAAYGLLKVACYSVVEGCSTEARSKSHGAAPAEVGIEVVAAEEAALAAVVDAVALADMDSS